VCHKLWGASLQLPWQTQFCWNRVLHPQVFYILYSIDFCSQVYFAASAADPVAQQGLFSKLVEKFMVPLGEAAQSPEQVWLDGGVPLLLQNLFIL
jgi:hypothetical protein